MVQGQGAGMDWCREMCFGRLLFWVARLVIGGYGICFCFVVCAFRISSLGRFYVAIVFSLYCLFASFVCMISFEE